MFVINTVSKGDKARAAFAAVISATTMVATAAVMFAMQAPWPEIGNVMPSILVEGRTVNTVTVRPSMLFGPGNRARRGYRS